MDRRDQTHTAGESAGLGGHSPLKPGQPDRASVGEDREPVISPDNRRESDEYRQQQANAEQGGDSTEGSREFLAGSGSGSSRKTGDGKGSDDGSPAGGADVETGEPAGRQDARLDDAATSGR